MIRKQAALFLALIWIALACAAEADGLIGTGKRSGEGPQAGTEPTMLESSWKVMNSVLAEQTAGKELQDWVDGPLTETVDGLGGWYLIALRRLGLEADYTRARLALEKKMAEAENTGVTKRERMALTLLALGSRNPLIGETADRAAEESTLMPLVFGLHLLNNGAGKAENRAKVLEKILGLQLADGGWAVIGEACDVDCTAMTLQALAALTDQDSRVREAIERGVEALSSIQQENGGFLGLGMESAESCAQVLLALSDLGIDGAEDERFVRSGGNVLEAMMRFRHPGAGFAHDPDSGRSNETATVQCFYALAGYCSMLSGGGPYYLFDFPESTETAVPAKQGDNLLSRVSIRDLLIPAAVLLTLLSWGIAWRRKKRNWRSYLFPALVFLAAAVLLYGVDIQSPEGYYAGGAGTDQRERNTETTIAISCGAIAGENAYAPENGIILSEETIWIAEGDTAFDQLLEATREHRIQMEYDGTTAGAYIRGIGYLYEYQFGNLSGWMYRVNGVFADVGCSQYRLEPGDQVEWVYTRNLGRDQE